MKIWIDGDGCPREVRELTLRAAARRAIKVCVVANHAIPLPTSPIFQAIRVPCRSEAADNHIAREVDQRDLVITPDLPLAAQVVVQGARVLHPRGEVLSEENVRNLLSVRNFFHDLRTSGVVVGQRSTSLSLAERRRFAASLERLLA